MRRDADARELLDGPLDDPLGLDGNLRDLARINRWLGGYALTERALDVVAGRPADAGRTISLLDVGAGGADIPVRLVALWGRRERRLEVVAVDERRAIVDAAHRLIPALERRGVRMMVGDGRALPFEDHAFDVAHCSLVLHHLDPRGAVAMLREMRRVASLGVIVNDVARTRAGYAGAWLLTRTLLRNRYTRHDAPLSVRRAYTLKEARAILAVAGLRPVTEFRAPFGVRWAIVARP